MDIDRKDYKGTPIGYPMGNSIKKEDELHGKNIQMHILIMMTIIFIFLWY